jgi:hypothetical protein
VTGNINIHPTALQVTYVPEEKLVRFSAKLFNCTPAQVGGWGCVLCAFRLGWALCGRSNVKSLPAAVPAGCSLPL